MASEALNTPKPDIAKAWEYYETFTLPRRVVVSAQGAERY
jgi:hypothetical protein